MKELETVSATLSIQIYVDCPNDECGNYIDLMSKRDTNEVDHDDDNELLRQVFYTTSDWSDFECEKVTCSQCKTAFHVKSLEF